ncbi:MAG: T9SS type A sorting domain-containing protein, partial [Flavobacteriales bacterium]
TWNSKSSIPHEYSNFTSADPSLVFDDNGYIFVSYIDFDKNKDSGSVFVRKSTDGGLNWSNSTKVIDYFSDSGKKPIDRPWIAVDRSGSTTNGNLYITTMSIKGAKSPFHPYFIKSTDANASWSSWRYLDTTNWLAGNIIPQPMPSPAVSPDGTFHAIYPSYKSSQDPKPQYIHASSSNAGKSIQHNTVFKTTNAVDDSLIKGGQLLIADPSDASHLAFIYLLNRNGDADVYLRESNDGGTTWPNEWRVNDDPISNDRMQDLVWGDFDSDGDLAITWRDRRNASDSGYQTKHEIMGAMKWKDSSSISPNFKVTDSIIEYDPILDKAGNDFMSVQLENDTMSAVWGDPRSGSLDIWFHRMDVRNGNTVNISLLNHKPENGFTIYPNPATSYLKIKGEHIDRVAVFDQKGKKVLEKSASVKNKTKIRTKELPSGIYFAKIKSNKRFIIEKFIKE